MGTIYIHISTTQNVEFENLIFKSYCNVQIFTFIVELITTADDSANLNCNVQV